MSSEAAQSDLSEVVSEDLPRFSRPLTPSERDSLIRATVASQALEGVELTYEEVAKVLDEVLSEPLVEIP